MKGINGAITFAKSVLFELNCITEIESEGIFYDHDQLNEIFDNGIRRLRNQVTETEDLEGIRNYIDCIREVQEHSMTVINRVYDAAVMHGSRNW